MSGDNKIALQSFAALVARRAKVSSVVADSFIHQFALTMSEELEAGGDIPLYRFGRFHTTHVDEKVGHDPNSGAALTIPEHTRVHFRPFSALRYAVNAPFRQLRIKELTLDKSAWRIRSIAWILLLMVVLLLIGLGIMGKSLKSTQDQSLESSEILSDNAEAAHSDKAPDTLASAPLESKPAPLADAPVESENTLKAISAVTEVLVVQGDTLWGIAATRLGDPNWWPIIYAESRTDLSHRNPDFIASGMTLRIPVLTGSVNSPNAADLRLKTKAFQIVADDYRTLDNPRTAAYATVAARGFKE
jgi:nucleoid DNA-binding protein